MSKLIHALVTIMVAIGITFFATPSWAAYQGECAECNFEPTPKRLEACVCPGTPNKKAEPTGLSNTRPVADTRGKSQPNYMHLAIGFGMVLLFFLVLFLQNKSYTKDGFGSHK